MFNNKFLISIFAVLFCLGLASVTMAYEYDEEVFGQTDSTMQMKVEHEKMVEDEGTLASKHDKQAEKKVSHTVFCATNKWNEPSRREGGRATKSKPATPDC